MQSIKWYITKAIKRTVFVLTLSFVLIICTIFHYSYAQPSVPADCALVFGSVVHGDSLPGPGIRRRVETAAALYSTDLVQTVFMSGGIGRSEQASEAEVMKRYALRLGVPLKDIVTENLSTSTLENIRLSAQNERFKTCNHVVAISDGYHLARIAMIMQWLGLSNVSYQATALPRTDLFFLRSTARESVALPYLIAQLLLTE